MVVVVVVVVVVLVVAIDVVVVGVVVTINFINNLCVNHISHLMGETLCDNKMGRLYNKW